jgi:hypothetical protein
VYRFGRKIGSGSFGEIYQGILDFNIANSAQVQTSKQEKK